MAIAVDAMGGDSPLSVQVEAAVRAVNDLALMLFWLERLNKLKKR